MSQVLQQFELAICSLRQYSCAKGFVDLFDGDMLTRQLVFGRADIYTLTSSCLKCNDDTGDFTYQTSPNAPIPTGLRSTYLDTVRNCGVSTHYFI